MHRPRTHRSWQALGFALVVAAGLATVASAQEAARRPLSPRGTASTQVAGQWVPRDNGEMTYQGGKWIDIDYGRPILRGRKDIFGSGADYGKKVDAGASVWRLGANQTTRLHSEVALRLGDKTLPAGDYSLFVDLADGKWTLIVSDQPYQEKYDRDAKDSTWGSYNYDPKHDVVRVPMEVSATPMSVDQLTIGFHDVTDTGGIVAVCWGETRATVAFGLAP
jgi:Protein of unknown function (DUF2911)